MYSVKDAYELITNFEDIANSPLYKVIWTGYVEGIYVCLKITT